MPTGDSNAVALKASPSSADYLNRTEHLSIVRLFSALNQPAELLRTFTRTEVFSIGD
jgi:hypothetical protein